MKNEKGWMVLGLPKSNPSAPQPEILGKHLEDGPHADEAAAIARKEILDGAQARKSGDIS